MKIVNKERHCFCVVLPESKRQRLSEEENVPEKTSAFQKYQKIPAEFIFFQQLLSTSTNQPLPCLPVCLQANKEDKGRRYINIQNKTQQLKDLLDANGLRTSMISSPRQALSVYKDSCLTTKASIDFSSTSLPPSLMMIDGKTWLITLLGLHPDQETLERVYQTLFKDIYCFLLFCHRIRTACSQAMEQASLADFISHCEEKCRFLISGTTTAAAVPSTTTTTTMTMVATNKDNVSTSFVELVEHIHVLSGSLSRLLATLIRHVVKAEPKNRKEQLQREYDHIKGSNSTLSNALMSLFQNEHDLAIKEIMYRQSYQPQYERIVIYLYDPEQDYSKPCHFNFHPSLHNILKFGPETVVDTMIVLFWNNLLKFGYFATQSTKNRLMKHLRSFFLSGISNGKQAQIPLNAHFSPTEPLSLYLHGAAGAGKSSFVRNFQPALEATIEEMADPEILARFVKQNLNKHYDVLELELELRPNNNDLSLMSIIQGRRMSMKQTKPGLVVVDLEEIPSNDPNADPNQLKVAQLISQRFAGRNGDFEAMSNKPAPRNSDKRGICNDSSLVTIFTSNYELNPASESALKRLKMFRNLECIKMTAVSGKDRIDFASSYLYQCLRNMFPQMKLKCEISLDISIGEGDTRPLVRYLRMLAFYLSSFVPRSVCYEFSLQATIYQRGPVCTIACGETIMDLKLGTLDNLFPVNPCVHDSRLKEAIASLTNYFPTSIDELSVILDFWFAKTLAPAVIVSQDMSKIQRLMDVVESLESVSSIRGVNADTYKMMKSLYDPNNTPNLRNDILDCGRGATVAAEIFCPNNDAQLCIREIIEDSPSMTAFSTSKSALYKEGILFAVYVSGDITPEVRSRASLIL